MTALVVRDLGLVPYGEALALQRRLCDARIAGATGDTLLLLEHPPVITLGRGWKSSSLPIEPDQLRRRGIEVFDIERGGDVTYHGPGQLVAYPIVRLREGERDLHRFLRNLEEAMIRTLARFELAGGRADGKTGVWLGEKKIASIGIACRRWITFHGLALNVSTDLSYFARINPCGFEASVMTSMAAQLGRPVAMADVKAQLVSDLRTSLGRS